MSSPLTSTKKRKRSTDDASRTDVRPLAHRKNASISNLMDDMDIQSQSQSQSQSNEPAAVMSVEIVHAGPRKLKWASSKALKRKGSNVMGISTTEVTSTTVEEPETHGRQKRHRKEPTPPPNGTLSAIGLSVRAAAILTRSPEPDAMEKKKKKRTKRKDSASMEVDEEDDVEHSSISVAPVVNGKGKEPELTPMQAAMKARLQGSAFR